MLLNFSGICYLFYLCLFIDFEFFFKSHLIMTYSSGKDGVYPWVQQDKGLNKVHVDLIFSGIVILGQDYKMGISSVELL